jgi:EAL domain-containing protein (putative c-di-GMP-specific phosphodiesterase class I)
MHHEALARIMDKKGQVLPAQIFIRLAEEMECIQDLDKAIINSVIDCMKGDPGDTAHYAVNLSSISLKDEAFMNWLIETIRKVPEYNKRLIFETPEYGCVSSFESIKSSISRIVSTGSRFGLDHFGIGSGSLGYLIDLKLDYLKIDGNYTREIAENRDNRFFIQGIGNIAHGLDIKIICTCTEKEEEFNAMKSLGIDAAQGRLFS